MVHRGLGQPDRADHAWWDRDRVPYPGAPRPIRPVSESRCGTRLCAGPDGNLWFTEHFANEIGRITTNGTITDYLIPSYSSGPADITAGPDGNLWFTENYIDANRIGRITPAGEISEFPLPAKDRFPDGITAGPDGNVWFTERRHIGRIIPGGTPRAVKKTCPIYADPHTPIPKKLGNRTLTDEITTSTYSCVLRKPVVLCRPLAAHTAGERAFCTSTVSKRGKIRVKTGREPVRVTVIARAKPKPDFADRWKSNTWRESWILMPART